MACPYCGGRGATRLYPVHEGECVTSDLRLIGWSVIANMLCERCGFIFNAGGPRGQTKEFYDQAYQLRMHSGHAKNVNFSSQGVLPMAGAVADILIEVAELGQTGRLLDVGAGKGDFLLQFLQSRPQWASMAVEPSSAMNVLVERNPNTEVYQCEFREMQIEGVFDVVASLAVIEHVEQPLDFLQSLRDCIAPDGYLLVTFPDFARNPNDLFCVDHLSKITKHHLRMMAARAGLEIVVIRHVGIALVVILRRAQRTVSEIETVVDMAREIAHRNIELARGMIAAVAVARDAARSRGERFGVFGLGMAGLFGPILKDFDRSEIAAYIDENETMQGVSIGGRPVVGLRGIEELGLKHVAISASPIYRDQIREKLKRYDVAVYV